MSVEPEDLPIYVRSMYGMRSQQPLVVLILGERMTQMPPAKAREIAMMLIECAEAAEQDGFIVRFFMETGGLDQEDAARMLNEFRKMKDRARRDKE